MVAFLWSRRARTVAWLVVVTMLITGWSMVGPHNVAVAALSLAMAASSSSSSSKVSSTTTPTPNRVAVVTGATRGIGRGIALELGTAGYTVYCLGRSTRTSSTATAEKDEKEPVTPRRPPFAQRPVADGLDLTVEAIADEITATPGTGRGIPIPIDLSHDGSIAQFMTDYIHDHNNDNNDEEETKKAGTGRLDVLVCSAYTTPPNGQIRGDFWQQEVEMWDYVNGIGLRHVYAACHAATPYLLHTAAATNTNHPASPPPLICLVSSFGGKAYTFNVAYGVGKAAIDRLAQDMSYQLKKYGVATTALYPGLVQTEANLQMDVEGTWDEQSGGLDLTQGETPYLSGRAVVQLTSLPQETMLARSGHVEVVAELAKEFQFYEQDGTRPPSIRSLQYLLPNFVFPTIEQPQKDGKKTTIPAWIKNNIPDVLVPWSTFASGPPPEMDSR